MIKAKGITQLLQEFLDTFRSLFVKNLVVSALSGSYHIFMHGGEIFSSGLPS